MASMLFGFLVDLVLGGTGRALVRGFGRDRWRADRRRDDRVEAAAGALSFRKDGQRVVTVHGQWLIGLVFWGAVAVLSTGLLRQP